ncbi:MAG TPA: hypothetical protein ENJ32_12350 [Crenotrichaceae bacterium]|nr:hypothetical protein [Crenotrichaceae bacterium]
MFEMLKDSILLFLKGKLFQNPKKAYTQIAIGAGVTLVVFLIVASISSVLWGAILAGLVGGAIQPRLFRDLKYA